MMIMMKMMKMMMMIKNENMCETVWSYTNELIKNDQL